MEVGRIKNQVFNKIGNWIVAEIQINISVNILFCFYKKLELINILLTQC